MSKAKYHVPQPGEEIEFEDPSGFRYAITVAKWDSKHGIITTDDKRRVYVQNRSSINLAVPAPSAPKEAEPTATVTRRPTVGDWVEVIEVEENDIVKAGDVVKIIGDDHDSAPYEVKENGDYCLRESQVKLTDKRPTDAPAPASGAPEPRSRTEEHLFREPVAVSTEFTARLPISFASEAERTKAIADAEVEEKRRKDLFDKRATELDEDLTKILHAQRMLKEEIIADYQDYQNRVDYLRSLRVRGEK